MRLDSIVLLCSSFSFFLSFFLFFFFCFLFPHRAHLLRKMDSFLGLVKPKAEVVEEAEPVVVEKKVEEKPQEEKAPKPAKRKAAPKGPLRDLVVLVTMGDAERQADLGEKSLLRLLKSLFFFFSLLFFHCVL